MKNRSVLLVLSLACSAACIEACVLGTDSVSGPKGDDGAPGPPWTCEPSAGCVCEPATAIRCYTGPADTESVGICRAGVQVCKADGTGFGDCLAEVGPAPEDCATPEDDDCDGEANEPEAGCICAPDTLVACPYAGPLGTEGIGVCKAGNHVCDAGGTGYLAPCSGEVAPSLEYCGTLVDENCDGDGGCHGLTTWSKRFGDPFTQEARGVVTDSTGNAIVTGYFKGTIDFGDGPLTASSDAIYVAKFAADGSVLWSRGFPDLLVNNNDYGNAVAVDSSGNVFVAGTISGNVNFGCPNDPLTATANSSDVLLIKLDVNGACQWSRSFGDAEYQVANSIAVDAQGNAFVAGFFAGILAFDQQPLVAVPGSYDIFIAKFAGATGNTLWSRRFGDASDQRVNGLAVDAGGNVLMTGQVDGTVDFGGGPLVSAGKADAFVVKLDPTSANYLWSLQIGDAEDQFGQSIATDKDGNALVTGSFKGTIDFGGAPLTSAGGWDIVVAKIDSAGNGLWAKRFGDASVQFGQSIAATLAGDIVLSAFGQGTVDFGAGALDGSFGINNVMATKLDKDGNHIWSRRFGDGDGYGYGIAVDGHGNSLLAGTYAGTVDFGGGPLEAAGVDMFVTKLSP